MSRRPLIAPLRALACSPLGRLGGTPPLPRMRQRRRSHQRATLSGSPPSNLNAHQCLAQYQFVQYIVFLCPLCRSTEDEEPAPEPEAPATNEERTASVKALEELKKRVPLMSVDDVQGAIDRLLGQKVGLPAPWVITGGLQRVCSCQRGPTDVDVDALRAGSACRLPAGQATQREGP